MSEYLYTIGTVSIYCYFCWKQYIHTYMVSVDVVLLLKAFVMFRVFYGFVFQDPFDGFRESYRESLSEEMKVKIADVLQHMDAEYLLNQLYECMLIQMSTPKDSSDEISNEEFQYVYIHIFVHMYTFLHTPSLH